MTDDLKTTYIKFFAPVNGHSTSLLMNVVDQKLRENVEKFVILISSPGGSVFHGLSTHNYLQGLPVEVETHNFGSVDSIGVVMFLAGNQRYSVPDARFLIHPVSMTFSANTALEEKQIEERIKGLRIDTENIAGVIARRTSKDEKKIIRDMQKRTTLSPEEAQEYVLINKVKTTLLVPGADLISINMA